MWCLRSFGWLLVASLPFWQLSAAEDAGNKRFRERNEALHRPVRQNVKRAAAPVSSAASSSSSSFAASSSYVPSSYVPSFPASSTFNISFPRSSRHVPAPTPTPASCGPENCKFYSDKTAPYYIAEWPDVNFNTGEFYGGLTPIDESEPDRTLFWIFKPAQGEPVDEVTIWLNGGPGCSSLEGFLLENGPINWVPGQFHPSYNPFHWARLTNMIWVEQPVGTGYSQGEQRVKNEEDVAKEFMGFFKNWQKLFGIKNYKIYVTGESYAGYYIPYISAGMLDQDDKTYFDLSGALMYDACIGGCGTVQEDIPTHQFVMNNQVILNLNQSILDNMDKVASTCGLNDFIEKYLQFPPPGHQPTDDEIIKSLIDCFYVYRDYYLDVQNKNPCFNIYHIIDFCPFASDTLAPYFNRADVKKAIHAPLNATWEPCNLGVFAGNNGDQSALPIEAALPQVIEATNRVMVANGDWDSLVMTNGTLLSIQNMTWNGKLGFQQKPSQEFVVPIASDWIYQYDGQPAVYHIGPQGVMGIAHYERGLMWVETYQAGHMLPQYQPRAAWRQLQWVLGRIDTLWE